MQKSAKRLWLYTGINVATVVLLVLVIWAMMVALAVLSPEILTWPLYVLLAAGTLLSILSVKSARQVQSVLSRRIGLVMNGCLLGLNLIIIAGLAALFVSSTKEQFLIPEGYRGEVYVLYDIPDGPPVNSTRWQTTYPIPQDGILRTRSGMNHGWTWPKYYYVQKDGTREQIHNSWSSTIDRTPENLANDRDIGIYFPRTGSSDSNGCSVTFELFYVGTKADILRNYKETDLGGYLHDHPGTCSRLKTLPR
jgi:uncharacterized protein DUF6843